MRKGGGTNEGGGGEGAPPGTANTFGDERRVHTLILETVAVMQSLLDTLTPVHAL